MVFTCDDKNLQEISRLADAAERIADAMEKLADAINSITPNTSVEEEKSANNDSNALLSEEEIKHLFD